MIVVLIIVSVIFYFGFLHYTNANFPPQKTNPNGGSSGNTTIISLPITSPFDFEQSFFTALENSSDNYEAIKAKILAGTSFQKATKHLADMLNRYSDLEYINIGRWDVELKEDREYTVFCTEFIRLLTSLNIKAEITENKAFVKVDGTSLNTYRDQLLSRNQINANQ